MAWPALLEAKENIRNLSREIDRLLKESNALSKKDIAKYRETILAGVDESMAIIKEQAAELNENVKKHKKYVEAKSVFLRRHHKML